MWIGGRFCFWRARSGVKEGYNMCWDYEELRKLCNKKGAPDSTVYQNALQWKIWRVDYHAERVEAVWNDLMAKRKGPIEVGGQEWQKAEFASTAETEAAAQALHSMADILAQIVNKVVLDKPIPEGQVYLADVLKKLKRQGNASNIVSKIKLLKSSKEFKYLNAFVNTIKHRRLLDTDYRAEYGQGTRNEKGIRFKAFKYNGRHPTVWASDILGDYKKRIVDLICAVGNAVNAYLR